MWLATTAPASATVGLSGKLFVFDLASSTEMPLPDNLTITRGRASFASWVRGEITRKYICGAASDNLVFTENKAVYRLGIQAPTGALTNTAAPVNSQIGYQASGAAGITGSVIPYLRFFDRKNGRRSPLSGPGAAITLTNQGLSFSAVPSGPNRSDTGVSHVEVWVSVDGGLPRFYYRRDIGVSSFSGNPTTLGEAETEDIAELPVCSMNAIYHDRHVMAGDGSNPDRVYFSNQEDPETYGGLYLSTRNGEPVIGLAVVRDVLIIQCPTIHYYVQGYDETDLTMNVLEPYIGGLGHHTITYWNDVAVIPGTLGWYLCTGVSMQPIGDGIFDETWRKSILENDYRTNSWATTDMNSGLVKLNIRNQGVSIYGFPTSVYTEWVLDLRGGVNLMFDTCAFDRSAGATLANPGYYTPQLYSAGADGRIYLENVQYARDGSSNIEHVIHTPHKVVVEPIDPADCVRFVKGWAIVSNEFAAITVGVYAGNEYAWRQVAPSDSIAMPAQLVEQTVGASSYYYVANDRKLQPLNKCSGSAVSMRITCTNEGQSPPVELASKPAYGAFFFKGWGVDFSQDGAQFRGPEIVNAP